jgi:hypothetical protein
MNERLKQIAIQAKVEHCISHVRLQEFAELIVRECTGVVEGGRFLHDQAPTALFARECSGAIKKHFGIEE